MVFSSISIRHQITSRMRSHRISENSTQRRRNHQCWSVAQASKRYLPSALGGVGQLQQLKPKHAKMRTFVYASVYPKYSDDVPGRRFYSFRDVSRWDRFGFVVLAFPAPKLASGERLLSILMQPVPLPASH